MNPELRIGQEETLAQEGSSEFDYELWKKIKTQVSREEDETKLELKVRYRELVKAFHADKEMDEARKKEKNILMKKITEAYETQDLYALVKLEAKNIGSNKSYVEFKNPVPAAKIPDSDLSRRVLFNDLPESGVLERVH